MLRDNPRPRRDQWPIIHRAPGRATLQRFDYIYDANGNLTSTTAGQSFAWDVFSRMTSATGPGGTAAYTYNGDGLKIRRIGPDGTTRYYYDGIRPIWEADGAGAMTAQLDRDIFGNLLSRKEPAGTRRYYHFDGLGSTTALSDEGGVAVATLFYDAWGNQRSATGATVPNYRFTGAELDIASSLYHMGARFYDPTIGRWLSEDPTQGKQFEPTTLNLYAYADSNPVVHVDPDGKSPLLIIAGAVFGLGFGLGAYLGSHRGNATASEAIAWAVLGTFLGAGVGVLGAAAVTAATGPIGATVGTFAVRSGEQVWNIATSKGMTVQAQANVVISGRTLTLRGLSVYAKDVVIGGKVQVGAADLLKAIHQFIVQAKAAGYETLIVTWLDVTTGQ